MDLLDRYASAGIPAIDAQDKILVLKTRIEEKRVSS